MINEEFLRLTALIIGLVFGIGIIVIGFLTRERNKS